MARDKRRHILVGLMICLIELVPKVALTQDFALAIYGARLNKEHWQDSFSAGTEYADATVLVAAASWTAHHSFDDRLSWELEVQVGKHFGDQDHWEFNLPILAIRWHQFPWNKQLNTTFAWGIGPSYATRTPKVEMEINDESCRWLIHWFGEVTLSPPAENWEVLLRLHHRSDGFGTMNRDGGSNALGAGLRYRF